MLINMATVGGSTKGGKTVGGFFPEGSQPPKLAASLASQLALSVHSHARALKPLTVLLVTHSADPLMTSAKPLLQGWAAKSSAVRAMMSWAMALQTTPRRPS